MTEAPKKRLKSLNLGQKQDASSLQGYTRFIQWMRIAVPIGLALIILSLFAWPQLQESLPTIEQSEVGGIDITQAQNTLINPRYESFDKALHPYVITAQKAELEGLKQENVYLTKPQGRITLSQQKILDVIADEGIYDQKNQTLKLAKNIVLQHSQGYRLKTEEMFVDLKQGIVSSDVTVEITSDIGTLKAPSMVITDEGDNIRFNGASSLTVELNKD